MKKVLSLIVIVAAAAMVSCAGNTNTVSYTHLTLPTNSRV